MCTWIWVYKKYQVINCQWLKSSFQNNCRLSSKHWSSLIGWVFLHWFVYQQFSVFDSGEKTFLEPALCPQTPRLHQTVCLCDIFFLFFKLAYFNFNYNADQRLLLFLKYNHKSLGRIPLTNSKFMTHNLLVASVYMGYVICRIWSNVKLWFPNPDKTELIFFKRLKSKFYLILISLFGTNVSARDIIEEQKKIIAFFLLIISKHIYSG